MWSCSLKKKTVKEIQIQKLTFIRTCNDNFRWLLFLLLTPTTTVLHFTITLINLISTSTVTKLIRLTIAII